MARFVVKLPDIGEGMAEAEIATWHVKPGDRIAEDQAMVDVMTDKATVEIPSPVSGTVLSTQGQPGDKLAIGSELLVIDTDSDAEEEQPAEKAPPAPPGKAPETVAQPSATATKPSSGLPRKKVLASPAVRARAREMGIGLQFVPGSGPAGRVLHEDLDAVLAARSQGSSPAHVAAPREGYEDIKVIGLRRRIAERMALSMRQIPHFSYIEEVDVTALEDLRARLNKERGQGPVKLTILPFLMRALVRALKRYPQMNAHYDDAAEVIRRHHGVHIGIATQTSNGLLVPVVRHVEALDLWQCAERLQAVAAAARDGGAGRADLSGSTITVTSLGALGGLATTPVINHPEVAIIGVNRIAERPVIRNGRVEGRLMMNLSSSFDHRVIDGWDAAEFIQTIKTLLEQPALLFVEGAI